MKDEDKLGFIAMKFRGNRDEAHRAVVVQEYADVVLRLIETNIWAEFPAPEEMLPDEHMPVAFWDYWGLRRP